MDKSSWQLEKSVSVGHIITTVTIIVSAIWWAGTVETRIAVGEQRMGSFDIAVRQSEEANSEMRREIKSDFERVHDKLDHMGRIGIGNSPYLLRK